MALTMLAFAMVATFMTAIMTRRLSALVALTLVPIAFGLLGGFGPSLGAMMFQGVRDLAPTGVMLLFAILYFGVMIDAGLFDPLVVRITRIVRGDPVRITVGTALLTLFVSLDGDGTTTYMITAAAMLPLYRRLGMDVRKMACIIMMATAITNVVPWGGPTARAATALKLDPSAVFLPMIPALVVCVGWLLFVSYVFGIRERRRLMDVELIVLVSEQPAADEDTHRAPTRDMSSRRASTAPWNLLLTASLIVALVIGLLPLPILFMIAFAVALVLNYPSLDAQRQRLEAHAGNALSVAGLIFAAGIFTGILSGTGMTDAMARSVLEIIPDRMGPYMAPITALVSIPFTFLISNDAFYFGMLPILAQTATAYGITPEELARASLVGQHVHLLSPLVPSTYLLVGMARIEFGAHQRFSLPWALSTCLVMLASALLLSIFPLSA